MTTSTDPITIWAPTNITHQTPRDRLKELIRYGGIEYLRANPTRTRSGVPWRDKPYMDGIGVDLDEDDVLDVIADTIIAGADPEST